MYVYCSECQYDSGDKDNAEELAKKVEQDGGKMFDVHHFGWEITCPNGHTDESIRMD